MRKKMRYSTNEESSTLVSNSIQENLRSTALRALYDNIKKSGVSAQIARETIYRVIELSDLYLENQTKDQISDLLITDQNYEFYLLGFLKISLDQKANEDLSFTAGRLPNILDYCVQNLNKKFSRRELNKKINQLCKVNRSSHIDFEHSLSMNYSKWLTFISLPEDSFAKESLAILRNPQIYITTFAILDSYLLQYAKAISQNYKSIAIVCYSCVYALLKYKKSILSDSELQDMYIFFGKICELQSLKCPDRLLFLPLFKKAFAITIDEFKKSVHFDREKNSATSKEETQIISKAGLCRIDLLNNRITVLKINSPTLADIDSNNNNTQITKKEHDAIHLAQKSIDLIQNAFLDFSAEAIVDDLEIFIKSLTKLLESSAFYQELISFGQVHLQNFSNFSPEYRKEFLSYDENILQIYQFIRKMLMCFYDVQEKIKKCAEQLCQKLDTSICKLIMQELESYCNSAVLNVFKQNTLLLRKIKTEIQECAFLKLDSFTSEMCQNIEHIKSTLEQACELIYKKEGDLQSRISEITILKKFADKELKTAVLVTKQKFTAHICEKFMIDASDKFNMEFLEWLFFEYFDGHELVKKFQAIMKHYDDKIDALQRNENISVLTKSLTAALSNNETQPSKIDLTKESQNEAQSINEIYMPDRVAL